MAGNDLYQVYAQDSVIGDSPLRLVVALYEGAIEAIKQALQCFRAGDILGRSRMISKAVSILTELMASLDHEKGGEISANLKRLYSYMQCCLLEAHSQKKPEKMIEVEGLLTELLQAWQKISNQPGSEALVTPEKSLVVCSPIPAEPVVPLLYDSYFGESPESAFGEVFSF